MLSPFPVKASRMNALDVENQGSTMSVEQIQFFKGKQAVVVSEIIREKGLVHARLIQKEVDWFYNHLGIDDTYFYTSQPEVIATHVQNIYASKILYVSSKEQDFTLRTENEKSATFAIKLSDGDYQSRIELEHYIEDKYLCENFASSSDCDNLWRLVVYNTHGYVAANFPIKLRFYILAKPFFPAAVVVSQNEDTSSLDVMQSISDVSFFKRTETLSFYRIILEEAHSQLHPVVKVMETDHSFEKHLVVAYVYGSTHHLFSSISSLIEVHKLHSFKAFVESFSNGMKLISIYVRSIPFTDDPTHITEHITILANQISMLYVLPRSVLSYRFKAIELDAYEDAYAFVVMKFAHQFLNRAGDEYMVLKSMIEKFDPTMMRHLTSLKHHLRKDTFTEDRILECVAHNLSAVRILFRSFWKKFAPSHGLQTSFSEENLELQIKSLVQNPEDFEIFKSFIDFNTHVYKTNFFVDTKVALSFFIDPSFLRSPEFAEKPFAICFVVGSEFRAFHIRFRDISRGGVRIVKSATPQAYYANVWSLFDESYSLALTQQLKNKDLAEGGSKGVILLSEGMHDKSKMAFRKFIDAMLDLLIPCSNVLDYSSKPVLIFLGPDEGTAEFMDWAAGRAKSRGYLLWKSFATGKSESLGGIPHDTYGMTSRGIQEYVRLSLEKCGLEESSITKFQTGGSDGDLGSNSIKLSCDRTIAIVDGAGVLYDPSGLNREELNRLANARIPSSGFNKELFSSNRAFFIGISENQVVLSSHDGEGGHFVDNGTEFRNNFHLNHLSTADLFVPCGGRPFAVDEKNVGYLVTNGVSKWKIIIEGANIFFSQSARIVMEQSGAIFFKDSSTNKGGVICSSLEVLACLSFSDAQFEKHMMVADSANPPAFYTQYVKEVQDIIIKYARAEFNCLWKEKTSNGGYLCELSNVLSKKINLLKDSLIQSKLFEDFNLRRLVITDACPKILVETVGIENLLSVVPSSFLQALFCAQLASTFVYKYGLNPTEFAFLEFISAYKNGLREA